MSTDRDDPTTKETNEFTERTLLTLANDLVVLNETAEAIITKIRALAVAHRVEIKIDDAA